MKYRRSFVSQLHPTVRSLDAAAGASDDYAKSLGVKYVYTVELAPSEDTGNLPVSHYGFLLEEKEIVPVGREVLESVLVFARNIAEKKV